jgi:hypothetical protein
MWNLDCFGGKATGTPTLASVSHLLLPVSLYSTCLSVMPARSCDTRSIGHLQSSIWKSITILKTLAWQLACYVTKPKPDTNHHLGRSGRNVNKNVRVCGCVCVRCMHSNVLVAWSGSLPWRRGHIKNNCGKLLHDDLACPNMASATWLHTCIINYYWSHGAIRTHQLKYPHVKSW